VVRRVLLLVVLLLVALGTAARPTTCVVTPDPVLLSKAPGTYHVNATGGVPGEYYEVTLFQKHNPINDERRVWLGQADELGNVEADVPYLDRVIGSNYSLWPGEARLEVVRYRTGGGPGGAASKIATCTFRVTE
jgi:hypothetical protein